MFPWCTLRVSCCRLPWDPSAGGKLKDRAPCQSAPESCAGCFSRLFSFIYYYFFFFAPFFVSPCFHLSCSLTRRASRRPSRLASFELKGDIFPRFPPNAIDTGVCVLEPHPSARHRTSQWSKMSMVHISSVLLNDPLYANLLLV